jgi:hypothetical protein
MFTHELPLFKCLAAASDVVNTYVNDIGRPAQSMSTVLARSLLSLTTFFCFSGVYLRHGPEAQSVFATFAASFLVKVISHYCSFSLRQLCIMQLLQPKFATSLSREKRLEIHGLVQKVADLLGSSEVAIDDRHGPKLYSRFLKGLLATPMARVDMFSPSGMMNSNGLPHKRPARKLKTSSERSTPSVKSNSASPSTSSPASLSLPPADAPHDVIASVTGFDPPSITQSQSASRAVLFSQNDAASETNIVDWFPTPLPFDSELLQSMQSVQDSVWGPDLSLPGRSCFSFYCRLI